MLGYVSFSLFLTYIHCHRTITIVWYPDYVTAWRSIHKGITISWWSLQLIWLWNDWIIWLLKGMNCHVQLCWHRHEMNGLTQSGDLCERHNVQRFSVDLNVMIVLLHCSFCRQHNSRPGSKATTDNIWPFPCLFSVSVSSGKAKMSLGVTCWFISWRNYCCIWQWLPQ